MYLGTSRAEVYFGVRAVSVFVFAYVLFGMQNRCAASGGLKLLIVTLARL